MQSSKRGLTCKWWFIKAPLSLSLHRALCRICLSRFEMHSFKICIAYIVTGMNCEWLTRITDCRTQCQIFISSAKVCNREFSKAKKTYITVALLGYVNFESNRFTQNLQWHCQQLRGKWPKQTNKKWDLVFKKDFTKKH